MGLNLDKIRKKPAQFFSLTGFTIREFDELVLEFRIFWDQYSSHSTLRGKPRQRRALPRKTGVLPGYEDKLLFILVYLKTLPVQELQAATFSMSQPQANFWIHLLCQILQETLLGISDQKNKKLELLLNDCQQVLSENRQNSALKI
jgi:hypothetical protein